MYCSRCGPRTSLTYDKRPGYLSNITTNIHAIVKMEGNRFAKHISELYSRIFNCNSQLSWRVPIWFSIRSTFLWEIYVCSILFSTNILRFFVMNNQCKCLFCFALNYINICDEFTTDLQAYMFESKSKWYRIHIYVYRNLYDSSFYCTNHFIAVMNDRSYLVIPGAGRTKNDSTEFGIWWILSSL